MAKCQRETCFWPETPCNLGHLDHSKCPVLEANCSARKNDRPPPDAVAMPWPGGVLGLADLGFVAGCGKPTVLAIMGPQNAGKTTLLAAWYLLLGRGSVPDDELSFSGSYSLTGWEVVANSLRWGPGLIPPTFPAHTSSRGARVPGLLHLAFKRAGSHRRDYVMTDAPGEWFRDWAIHGEAREAEGARWTAEHADAFLLIADREALAGNERGAARTDIQLLARRLAGELRGRPVALLWTKKDIPISEDTEQAVRSHVLRVIPHAAEFAVSIISGSNGTIPEHGLLDVLRWVLCVRRPTVGLAERVSANPDFVFAFGAR